jgi:hypothetical protein
MAGARTQAGSIVITSGSTKTKLMLDRTRDGVRPWHKKRPARKASSERVEGTVYWDSWHGGVGYGHEKGQGHLRAVTANSTVDTRWKWFVRLNPALNRQTAAPQADLCFDHAGYFWAVGYNSAGPAWNLYQFNTAGALISTTALGGQPSGPAVAFDGVMYIPMGFGINAWSITAAPAIVQLVTVTVNPRFGILAAGPDKLYFTVTNAQTVRSIPTGAGGPADSAVWSGPLTVSDSGHSVTALLVQDTTLYIGRTDGLYGLDSKLVLRPLMPDLAAYTHADNCRGMIAWHGGLLVPHVRDLLFFRDGITTPVGSKSNRENTTDFRPVTTRMAFVADGDWVYFTCGLQNDAATSVSGLNLAGTIMAVAARERSSDDPPGNSPLMFHVLYRETTVTVSGNNSGAGIPHQIALSANFSNGAAVTGPLLVFGCGYSLLNASVASGLQILTNTPVIPSGDTFLDAMAASGTLTLAAVDIGEPLLTKYARSVEIDVQCPTANQTVQIKYAVDPLYTNAGSANLGAAITTTGRTEISFPANTTFRDLVLELALASNGAVRSPAVWRVALNYATRPDKNDVYVGRFRLVRGNEDGKGTPMKLSPATVLSRLESYETTQVSVVDPYGTTMNMLVIDVSTDEGQSPDDSGEIERIVTVEFERVP